MDLEFERNELSSHLLSFGLTDAQARTVLAEFERHSFSLGASEFAALLEKFGYSRASAISLLRELGASERDLLSALAPNLRHQGEAIARLSDEKNEKRQKTAREKNPPRRAMARRRIRSFASRTSRRSPPAPTGTCGFPRMSSDPAKIARP